MFVPINGYEKYYTINEEGMVYSIRSKMLLKPTIEKEGYLVVSLKVDGISKQFRIHRLVAQQFLPNSDNNSIIDHIDRNKQNNDVKNLRWTTASINMRNVANRTEYPNIEISKYGTYRVRIKLNKKFIYDKTFKTLDEALSERDCAFDFYGIENPCYK